MAVTPKIKHVLLGGILISQTLYHLAFFAGGLGSTPVTENALILQRMGSIQYGLHLLNTMFLFTLCDKALGESQVVVNR